MVSSYTKIHCSEKLFGALGCFKRRNTSGVVASGGRNIASGKKREGRANVNAVKRGNDRMKTLDACISKASGDDSMKTKGGGGKDGLDLRRKQMGGEGKPSHFSGGVEARRFPRMGRNPKPGGYEKVGVM